MTERKFTSHKRPAGYEVAEQNAESRQARGGTLLIPEKPIREPRTELEKREQDAWEKVLGVKIEIKPLPDYVTPEVQEKLKKLGLELRYIPNLKLNPKDLEKDSAEEYLTKLTAQYPNWKPLGALNDTERTNRRINRNLNEWYWKAVKDEEFGIPAAKLTDSIKKEKSGILADIGLPTTRDIRLLEVHEYNLLANRDGWGRKDSFEWTNTKDGLGQFIIGNSEDGGAGCVSFTHSNLKDTGFRLAIILPDKGGDKKNDRTK